MAIFGNHRRGFEIPRMSEIKGFEIVQNPNRAAEEWLELVRAGKREEAAAQVAEEARRKEQASNAAIDAHLRDLENSRR